jgi:hypothetical protein
VHDQRADGNMAITELLDDELEVKYMANDLKEMRWEKARKRWALEAEEEDACKM